MNALQKFIFVGSVIAAFLVADSWFQQDQLQPPPAGAQKEIPYFSLGQPPVQSSTPPAKPKPAFVSPQSRQVAFQPGPGTTVADLQSAFADQAATASFYRAHNTPPPSLKAQGVLVADVASGERFFETNGGNRWPMASVTKLMTAAVALQLLNSDKEVAMIAGDFVSGGTHVLRVGERYRVRDLMVAMLLASSNEAAEALARAYGRAAFVDAMNRQADQWGMKETNFSDPTGLSVSNQSTLHDLQAMAARIWQQYPQVFVITRNASVRIEELGSRTTRDVASINEFAGRADFLGGKTGYTDESGGNLVSLFAVGGRTVFVAVIGTSNRFSETDKIFSWFKYNFAPAR